MTSSTGWHRRAHRPDARGHGHDARPSFRRVRALGRAVAAAGDRPRNARAGSIRILDEPTSNLDVKTEYRMIFSKFHNLAVGRTTILISHRFSTVSLADRIIVMDSGRVVEEGAHDSLVARRRHLRAAVPPVPPRQRSRRSRPGRLERVQRHRRGDEGSEGVGQDVPQQLPHSATTSPCTACTSSTCHRTRARPAARELLRQRCRHWSIPAGELEQLDGRSWTPRRRPQPRWCSSSTCASPTPGSCWSSSTTRQPSHPTLVRRGGAGALRAKSCSTPPRRCALRPR